MLNISRKTSVNTAPASNPAGLERLSVSFGPCEGGVGSSEVGVSQLPQRILAEKVNFPELIDD